LEGVSKTQVPPATFLGLRRTAWIEIAIFFIAMLVLDYTVGHGIRFFAVSPHPFWIIVLLISIQYGTNEGVVTALIATLILLSGNIPTQSVMQDRFEYIIYLIKNPLLWFAAAIFIGELRVRQIKERDDLRYSLSLAEEREATIAESYESLKKIKESMELHIAGEMQTALKAYQVFKKLESLSKEEILLGAKDLMSVLINPKKYSVYALTTRGFELITSEGWEKKDSFAEIFLSTTLLYREIASRQRVLCVINLEDRDFLENEGVLAAPIFDPEGGEVFGMIKVELIPFLQLKVTTIETLKLIGEWIGKAYSNRLAFERAKEASLLNPQTLLFSPTFFDYQRDFITALGKRLNFDVTLVKIILLNADELTIRDKLHAGRLLNRVVKMALRSVDRFNQPFEYQKMGGEFAVLLPGTTKESAQVVVERMKERLAEYPEAMSLFRFEYHILALYEHKEPTFKTSSPEET
jgi:polysaccharide biosynthesis protein PelD